MGALLSKAHSSEKSCTLRRAWTMNLERFQEECSVSLFPLSLLVSCTIPTSQKEENQAA